MKKRPALHSPWVLGLVYVIVGIIMFCYESVKELLFNGTLTPWQSHTITIIFTAAIASVAAAWIRRRVISIMTMDNDLEISARSQNTYKIVLRAVNHIVNNILNYLQLVRLEVEQEGRLSQETIRMLDESIKEASQQMQILNKIQNPSDPGNNKDIYPNTHIIMDHFSETGKPVTPST